MTTKTLKFLGLGSMVEVDDMDAPHPFGDVPKQKDNILVVGESNIKKVHVEGYVDEKDDRLLEEFLDGMKQTISKTNFSADKVSAPLTSEKEEEEVEKKAALHAQKQAENEELKRLELEKEQLRRDPFYKFRKKVEE